MKPLNRLRQQTGRQMTADISQVVVHPRRPPATSRPHDCRWMTANPLHPQPSMMSRVPVYHLAAFLPVMRPPPLDGPSSSALMATGPGGARQCQS